MADKNRYVVFWAAGRRLTIEAERGVFMGTDSVRFENAHGTLGQESVAGFHGISGWALETALTDDAENVAPGV